MSSVKCSRVPPKNKSSKDTLLPIHFCCSGIFQSRYFSSFVLNVFWKVRLLWQHLNLSWWSCCFKTKQKDRYRNNESGQQRKIATATCIDRFSSQLNNYHTWQLWHRLFCNCHKNYKSKLLDKVNFFKEIQPICAFCNFSWVPAFFELVFQLLISAQTRSLMGVWQPSGLDYWSLLTAAYPQQHLSELN